MTSGEKNSEKVVVVGFGWVGQANALALTRMGYEVFYYDVIAPHFHYADEYSSVYERIRPISSALEKDSSLTWYIVCIGDRVNEAGEQDISLIERALEMFKNAEGKVILRSTILPGHLKNLQFQYYFPEFLHEIKAVEECINPYYYVLGEREKCEAPSFLREWEERARKVFKGTPEEASHVKYLSNIWNAMRVGFINEFGDSIALPINNEQRQKNERILDFILERKSYLRYGQGFGGHCLPKDLRAYTASKRQEQHNVGLFRALQESNARHEEIVKQYQTLPQWFSFWDYEGGRSWSGKLLARFWKNINDNTVVRRARHFLQPARRMIENIFPDKTLPEIKRAWNERANENAYYYANPDTKSEKKVDEFEVKKSGGEDYLTYVQSDNILHDLIGDFKNRTALEIGSGVGRMTENFAKDFATVYGVDISPAMIEISRKRLFNLSNTTFIENAGDDLPFPDELADFIFSYLTFRHFSNRDIVEKYAREMARVLKRGGLAKIQLRTGPEVYRWRWFHGITLTPEEARDLFARAGFEVLKTEVENVKSLWIIIKKP